MLYLLTYLGIGLLNVLWAARYELIKFDHKVWAARRWNPIEVAFYILLWPVQLAFWTLVSIHNGIEWLFEKVMN